MPSARRRAWTTPAVFSTGSDSPVSAVSLTKRSLASRTRQSAGIMSPEARRMISPTTTCSKGISSPSADASLGSSGASASSAASSTSSAASSAAYSSSKSTAAFAASSEPWSTAWSAPVSSKSMGRRITLVVEVTIFESAAAAEAPLELWTKSIMPEISTIAVMMTTVDGSFSPSAARATLVM